MSRFSLGLRNLLVQLIIAEVVSEHDESDRYRMLFQVIVAACVAKYFPKSSSGTFVLMAIYITKRFIEQRYMVPQADSSTVTEVQIVQDDFDLLDMD